MKTTKQLLHKKVNFFIKSIILILAIAVFIPIIMVPIQASNESDIAKYYEMPYVKFQADAYMNIVAETILKEEYSYSHDYYNKLSSDKDFQNALDTWNASYLATEPIDFIVNGGKIISERDMYKLALFDLIDNQYEVLQNDKNLDLSIETFAFSLAEEYLDREPVKNLKDLVLTNEYKSKITDLETMKTLGGDIIDGCDILMTAADGIASVWDAMYMCAKYKMLSDIQETTKQMLYAIATDVENPKPLRQAASDCINFLKMDPSDFELGYLTEKTSKKALSISVDCLWDNITGTIPVINAYNIVADGIEVLQMLINSDGVIEKYYSLKAIVGVENATRRLIRNTTYNIDIDDVAKAQYCMELINSFQKAVILGYDYSASLLETQLNTPINNIFAALGWGNYATNLERCREQIKIINTNKANKVETYRSFAEVTYKNYAEVFLPVAQWDISETSSDSVTASLYNYPSGGYRLIISGMGCMEDYNSIETSPWYPNRGSIKSVIIKSSVTGIGDLAFYGCTSLTSITIPNSVLSIGISAFNGCTSLTSVTIGDSVTSIGGSAFNGCTSLTSVMIPNSVTSIGSGAFYCCTSLTSVTIGDSVTSIGNSTFYGCTSLTSITIPDSVASIDGFAFSDCTSLTSVMIPNSVTSIGSGAFYCCTSLTSVTIGDSVTSIGNSTFYGCTSLTSVTIGDSVTSIGESAFQGCTRLTSVTIPDSVTSIGDFAFYGCTSLESVTIGDSVTSIGGRAFMKCTSLTGVIIPNSVVSIGDAAFADCTSLANITIGVNVTSIGESAFADCTSFTSVAIPNSVTSIGGSAFYGCTSLESVSIPDSVTSIGDFAFGRCSNLTSATIGDSLTSIGEVMFYECSSLTSVTIGDSVTSIGESAFQDCTSLTSITIPDSVTSIGDFAFSDCTSLTSVTIGDSVTSIGGRAFMKCASLTGVIIPNSVVSIGDAAFVDCTNLANITIGVNVTSIGELAFADCTSLTSITIPDSVTSIGDFAFSGCTSLNRVNITDVAAWCNISFENHAANPLDIAHNLYLNDELVTELIIPDGVTRIGNWTFCNCTSFKSVTIPVSITSIGESAFYGCTSLTSITLPFVGATKDGTDNTHFGYIFGAYSYYDNVNYVPASLKTVVITGGTRINEDAFYKCNSITNITISDSVTTIGNYAFRCCENLLVVNSGSKANIGDYAFEECTNLSEVKIGDECLFIGGKAFKNCSNLKSVIIGKSVIAIGDQAFYRCYSLGSVIFKGTCSQWGAISIDNNYGGNAWLFRANITALGHDYEADVTEPTCTEAGYTTYTCHCGDSYVADVVDALGHNYTAQGDCTGCGEYRATFSGASLTLEDNIAVNFKVSPEQFVGTGYSNPYVVFTFNGEQYIVTEYSYDSKGWYSFTFSDISPRMMNDVIVATLYATYEGEQVVCQTISYSVKEYCYNMLSRCNEGGIYANNEKFKALLVDLLNYGEAAQIYGDYNVDTLVTADLTETQKSWATDATPTVSTVQNLRYKTINNPSVSWKAGGLLLEDAVTMRFKFSVDSIEDVTVKFYTDSDPTGWVVGADELVEASGGYYVYFDGLKARQMRETVYVTVYRGDTVISNTVRYSIESYVYAKKNDSNAKLTALLEAMMKYGDSAYRYING